MVSAGDTPTMDTDLLRAPGRSAASKVPAPTWIVVPEGSAAKMARATVAHGFASEQSWASSPPLATATT